MPKPVPPVSVTFSDDQFESLLSVLRSISHIGLGPSGPGSYPGAIEFLSMSMRDHVAASLDGIATAIERLAEAVESLKPSSTSNRPQP